MNTHLGINIASNQIPSRFEAWVLALIIGMSFLFHYVSGIVFALTIIILTGLFIILKPLMVGDQHWFVFLWFPAMIMIAISFLLSQKSLGALMDILILFCGILLVLFSSRNADTYRLSMKIVVIFGVYFAIGVIMQRFMPNLYLNIIQYIPGLTKEIVERHKGYTTGFSVNPGYTAGYICAAILALISPFTTLKSVIKKKNIITFFLFIALLFTGKRGHVIYLIITLMIGYLLPIKGQERIKRFATLSGLLFLTAILVFIFRGSLTKVPTINRIFESISNFSSGEDISNVRLGLSSWAWDLFKKNMFLGIGWGNFKTTVVGNVTLVAILDTHNIYFQLLCETGIIGFFCIVTPLISFWALTCKHYQRYVEGKFYSDGWHSLLFFSFSYQTFFLIYGFAGNVLYDQHFQIIYMFSCSIIIAYLLDKHFLPLSL